MAASSVLSEDHLLCSICLEIFNDPVSTSCGHNFCKICIYHHWDHTEQYQCPICKEDFSTRPQLKTNTFISEMVSQFRGFNEEPAPEEPEDPPEPNHVHCDVCSEPRRKALKSCLVCLASYCSTHLEPHLSTPRLQRHQLIRPVENLEERICNHHDRPLELLCQKEKILICLLCTFSEHREHFTIPLRQESERQQDELKTLIELRRQKIQEIEDSVKVNNNNADREMAEGVKVFTALMESVQKSLDRFKEGIMRDQKNMEHRAAELIENIEQEIHLLQQRGAEMEQTLTSEDYFSFVQIFSSLKNAPVLKDWTNVTFSPQLYDGLVFEAVAELEKKLHVDVKKVHEAELRRVQQFEIKVTLDPDTAHPCLVLSGGNKQVHYRNVMMNLSDLPQRFSTSACVLGQQKLSSGRSYFQVQVKGNTGMVLGVARESVERKGPVKVNPEAGYWTILEENGQYKACAGPAIPLSQKFHCDIVGVFVDFNKRVVSFYDVNAADLIYSFTECSFSGNLLPFFAPEVKNDSKNSAPLTITSVKNKRK